MFKVWQAAFSPGGLKGSHETDWQQGFQNLKSFNLDNFLDSKIAEEQAKQAQQSKSSSSGRRTPSNAATARRSSARPDSPSKRAGSRLRAQDGDAATPGKAPDPEDFVIGEDTPDISRVTTPMPVKEETDGPVLEEKEKEKED